MNVKDPTIRLAGDRVDKGINVQAWSGESQSLANFTLKISSGLKFNSLEIQLNESYYYFTAPEGAPSCEVYNFSVTATYVGATYTGAGCSVNSPVLSTMLPSLPNISQLESSLGYALKKKSTGFALYISFEVCIHAYNVCCL